jgi:hypothetical protein
LLSREGHSKRAPAMSGSKRPITDHKKPNHDRILSNDEPKHHEIHAAQSFYFITGVSKFT